MTLVRVIDDFPKQHLLVVGDVFLDEYLFGRGERLSREAPIPVLAFRARQQLPGGGANPAMNLAALGARVSLIGVTGDDPEAATLRALLANAGVAVSGLVADASRPTITKTRIVAEGELRFPQQVVRIDRQSREPLSAAVQTRISGALHQLAVDPTVNAILFSDYRAGLISSSLIDSVRIIARNRPLALTADAQGDLDKYRDFDLLKCNRAEAEAYLGKALMTDDDFERALTELTGRLNVKMILITRGANGISLGVRGGGHSHLPATNVSEVYDVTGAGDTVIAVATLALCVGADPVSAASLANHAAGLVVRRWGNAVVTREELKAEVMG
jgi:rfaE bifunctional protein kinase chain/domain